MSLLYSLSRREKGFEFIRDYDIALCRLKCYYNDIYHITPNLDVMDFNPEPPVFACRFSIMQGYEQILALANEDGKLAIQDTSKKGLLNPLEGIQAHRNAIFDIAWMPGELRLLTASGDHTVCLWDVTGPGITQLECFQAHTRSVKTAVFRHEDKAVFATGARDGSIMIWDIRAGHSIASKPDDCIFNGHNVKSLANIKHRRVLNYTSRAQSITGLAFQDDFTLISCAAGDGLIKVWDLRKNYNVHKKDPVAKYILNNNTTNKINGFSSLLVCPARINLYASCMNNTIYAYNISSYNPKPVAEFYGHQNCTYYVKTCLSYDGRYLASGSSDELAYIWNTNKPGDPRIKLSGHTEEVTCIAWCNTGETKIVTCSDDSCYRIWRVGYENKVDNEEMQIRGQAIALNNKISFKKLPIRTILNRMQQDMSSQQATVQLNNTPDNKTENLNNSTGVKRNYFQMTTGKLVPDEKLKSILSPIQENVEVAAKRTHTPNYNTESVIHLNISTMCEIQESDKASTSSSKVESSDDSVLFSFTSNLPNFVIDGTAPHLIQMSPEKCKENIDWLTKIRKERYERTVKRSSNPKAVTPVRKDAKSKSIEFQKAHKAGKVTVPSLLNFFKVISKDYDKDICSESGLNLTDVKHSNEQQNE